MLAYAAVTSASAGADRPTLAKAPSPSVHARLRQSQPTLLPSATERTKEAPRSPAPVAAQLERPKPVAPVLPAFAPDLQPLDSPAQQQAHTVSRQETATLSTELDGYLPRPLLTQPPVLRAPIEIRPPKIEGKGASDSTYVGVLSLFIDEDGKVRHILSDEPPLPYEFEQAAREAFLAASFMPGVRDGNIAKSRLRVEVVFDANAPTHSEPTALAP